MPSHTTSTNNKNRARRPLLAACLTVSVLLHLLLLFILQGNTPQPVNLTTATEQPTIVRLVDKTELMQNRELEIDQKPVHSPDKPTVKTRRLAEENQRVSKEQAPEGTDVRDQAKSASAAAKPPAPQRQARKQKQRVTTKKPPAPRANNKGLLPPSSNTTGAQEIPKQPATPYPDLQQLTRLTAQTRQRSINSGRSEQKKIKQRDDIEKGDTVWLNLERGMLISFFRRFRNQIEGVWNYPPEAAQRGIEGLLLLKITIARTGELIDIDLLDSSGSDILDYEALQAVYRAAPFGPLPKHYPHPQLKIHAHFRYQISGKYIYGRP